MNITNNKWGSRIQEGGFLKKEASLPRGIKSWFRKEDAGRLASTVEGGRKLRIFAIGNFVKQCLLRSPHDWCMWIENDGTFDQISSHHKNG